MSDPWLHYVFGRQMQGYPQIHLRIIYLWFLSYLNFDSTLPNAVLAKDPIDTSEVRVSALRSMAGNGMSLPCAGFTLLMAVLFVEDK